MYWWQSSRTAAQAPDNRRGVETKTTTATIEQGLWSDSPQFEIYTSAVKSRTGEAVESFYLPKSPLNEDVVFVSTSAGTTGTFEDYSIKSTNKIYSYNTKTGELSKLHEEQETRLLRTMGIEGTKLIVMYDGIDNSPGPCFSVWANWKDFGYLEVANPNSLRPYTVPDYQVQKGRDEQKKCEKENGL
jgi:hypothetical protein